ncbi:extensin-like domain-containing protein [Devosia sp. SL43]|uniref:extensin-like domain-containing protein n=1 Tax=Devosia sp. SL43 TaxID=2806348 RepID=UPI001F2C4173|nr:extensin family protein [Devosia sp. SL43]UJW84646.1 extensin family protein [Devosia sp. SL43]
MLTRLTIALPLLLATPAMAQDILGPIQDFVDELTAPPAQAPTRPAPPVAPVADPPPVPRPRPPSLPDVPVVQAPEAPAVEAEPEPEVEVQPEAEVEAEPVAVPEPEPEPERVYQVACPAVMQGLVEAEMAPPLSEGMCGEQSPLVVTAVLVRGRMVPLSSPVTTNCQIASAMPGWAETVDGYAGAMLESELASIDTGTSYMCRPVVGGEAGRTSEHGFANAIDVTGFTLADGRSIAVEANWLPAAAPEGRLLRLAHDAACGDFMTVLGPEANAEHEDHLHLDLGCHGQSCTARICE